MIIDVFTIIFVFLMTLLVIILTVIFVKRQALRMRNNSARKEVSGVIASELSKGKRDVIVTRIEGVARFRQAHVPTFTDCTIISDHASSPYVYRMIAIDEIAENIDRQVEMIDPTAGRRPGESTYVFLKRLRECAGCRISLSQAERLGFLHELCRFRPQWAFDFSHLKELRSLLKDFLKTLNEWQKNRSEGEGKNNDSDIDGVHYHIAPANRRLNSLSNDTGLSSNKQQMEPLLGKASSTPNANLETEAATGTSENQKLLQRKKTNAQS
ncbi:hypothetical protein L596_007493 [Steinernema carpocapsae]|uniref:Defect at low temperature protein 1 n=1 Tax=Steinernema carpocapsae TaxID=34508 RepID=A0A4U5PA55_STECR|nr:hypothetical protein L596_007493 [Steinernema carpocapsae]